jgi:SAM-dependent methyltransferase
MTQQPILTASEVIELLKDALPDDETLRAAFWMVVEKSHRFSSRVDQPTTEMMEVMQHCANFLRSRGIFVYMKPNRPSPFLVGKFGMAYEKLEKQAKYLTSLLDFIYEYRQELPEEMVKKCREVFYYKDGAYMQKMRLISAYSRWRNIEKSKLACEEAWKFAKEIDDYLERNIDLCRVYAMVTAL